MGDLSTGLHCLPVKDECIIYLCSCPLDRYTSLPHPNDLSHQIFRFYSTLCEVVLAKFLKFQQNLATPQHYTPRLQIRKLVTTVALWAFS